jgi:predicted Zn-dependent protease
MSNLALALNELGRPLDALVPLERAVALQPGNVALRMNLCQVIVAAGRGGDAIRCFEQAVAAAKTPDDILQTQYALAQAQAASGQVAEAVASLERALTAPRQWKPSRDRAHRGVAHAPAITVAWESTPQLLNSQPPINAQRPTPKTPKPRAIFRSL